MRNCLNIIKICSAKLCDKNGHFGGFIPHIYIFRSDPFKNIIPHLEVIFFNNHYFLVCIFKYCKSLRVKYG